MWLLVAPAWADTIVVALDGSGDYAQIQDAIDVARAGDVVLIGPGTYRGALEVRSRHLTLRGQAGAEATVLDGAGAAVLLTLRSADVTLEGLTLRNDGAGGVATWDRTDLVVRDVVVAGMGSPDGAGAVYLDNGTGTFEGVEFRDGAGSDAWALQAAAGEVTVSACTFTGGDAPDGAVHLGANVVATFSDTRVEHSSGVTAGGMVVDSGAEVTLDEVIFEDNRGGAGALSLAPDARLVVRGGRFAGGVAAVAGGALRLAAGADVLLQRTQFEANEAPLGADVALEGAALDDLESTWAGGATAALGAVDATVVLVGSRMAGAGGAVDATGGTLELRDVVLGPGGGVRQTGGTVTGRGVTAADVQGLFVLTDAVASVEGVVATGGGALLEQTGGAVTMSDLAVAGWSGRALTATGGSLALADSAFADGAGPLLQADGSALTAARLRVVQSGDGGALVAVVAPVAGSTLSNLELVAPAADPAVALTDAGALRLAYSTLVGGSGRGVVVTGAAPALTGLAFAAQGGAAVEGGACAWCGFDRAAPPEGTEPAVGDPAFLRWSADAPAEADLHLGRQSVLVDAGDPATLDADGSRSDIGAWGGADAGPFVDADGDGATTLTDCDDDDPLAHPGATEFWYDGADQDCDGVDADRDGDGVPHPEDCDDDDPAVGACPAEDSGGGDPADDADCGCAGAAGATAPGVLGLALALGRRAGRARPR